MSEQPELDRVAALRRVLVASAEASLYAPPPALRRRRATAALAFVASGLLAGSALTAIALGAGAGAGVPGTQAAAPPTSTESAEPPGHATGESSGGSSWFGGSAADYNLAKTPAELAASVPVVLRGVVAAVEYVPTSVHSGTVIFVLRGVSVAQGSLDARDDGTVHLEIPAGVEDMLSVGDFDDLFPAGTEVVVYATPGTGDRHSTGTDEPPGENRDDPFYITGPQGFAVQLPGSDEVAWPMLGDAQAGRIADTLPDGTLIGGIR